MMIIEHSSLNFDVLHSRRESYSKKESLEFWVGERQLTNTARPPMQITDRTRQVAAGKNQQKAAADTEKVANKVKEQVRSGDHELDIIIMLMKATYGIDFEISDFERLEENIQEIRKNGQERKEAVERAENREQDPGWGLIYQKEETYSESEMTRVSIGGNVMTKDGKEISVNLLLEMSRSYERTVSVDFRAGNAQPKDPLMISFNGQAADLQNARFTFDLDADGTSDAMPYPKAGRGYLVLDKNGNGAVDNGKELFGPQTGNGYRELAGYDHDNNGWIDEADPVYSKLGVWSPSRQKLQEIASLKEKNIGAIHLEHAPTPFEIKDASNEPIANVRSTGMFLKESGGAGVVQQLDLFV